MQKAKKIKLVAIDIDGVLTAGEFIILNSGEEMKIWNIRDRFGYILLRESGLDIKLAWITARESKQVNIRAKELSIEFPYQNYPDKLKAVQEIMNRGKYNFEDILFIGDDWLDIPVLSRVGLSVCPKNAHDEIKNIVDYVSKYNGGKGVFREVVEIILKSRNLYETILKKYKN